MSATERQWATYRLLRTRAEGYGLADLAHRFGVSKNTCRRDLDALSRAGVPIREDQQGQRLVFKLEPEKNVTARAPLPAVATEMAVAALGPYRQSAAGRIALEALAEQGPDGLGRVIRPEHVRSRSAGSRRALLLLTTAINGNRRVAIGYRNRAGEHRRYEVEPYDLFLYQGEIYLRAKVPPHRDLAHFALARVGRVKILDRRVRPGRFRPRTGFGAFEGEPVVVEIKFDAAIAEFIEEKVWHPSQRTRRTEDGSLTFTARTSGMHEVVGWVMSWGYRANLIRPPEWRQEIRQRLGAMLQAYESRDSGAHPQALPEG